MAKFTKISNGYTLEIEIDEARLLTEIDEYINEMQELKKEITDKGEDTRKKALQVICDNIWNVKINNYPEDNAPSRGEMPQTDKAGQEKGSKPSSYPDKEGSALNRMKNGKFDSGAIK